MELRNRRMHNESQKAYRDRQKLMKHYVKLKKKGTVRVPMQASQRIHAQRGVRGLRSHHDPDKNYGSLSKHKRWAAIRCNKPSKLLLVEQGMARLRRAFNINM